MANLPKNTDGAEERSPVTSLPGTEPLWTVDDVASYLRLNPETVRAMARRRELPSVKVGKRIWRFKISEIKDWLKSHT
jgi:excisionase family DNA binding protein